MCGSDIQVSPNTGQLLKLLHTIFALMDAAATIIFRSGKKWCLFEQIQYVLVLASKAGCLHTGIQQGSLVYMHTHTLAYMCMHTLARIPLPGPSPVSWCPHPHPTS